MHTSAVNLNRYDGILAATSATLPSKVARSFLLPPILQFPSPSFTSSSMHNSVGIIIALVLRIWRSKNYGIYLIVSWWVWLGTIAVYFDRILQFSSSLSLRKRIDQIFVSLQVRFFQIILNMIADYLISFEFSIFQCTKDKLDFHANSRFSRVSLKTCTSISCYIIIL